MKSFLLFVALAVIAQAPACADDAAPGSGPSAASVASIDPAKEAEIREMIRKSGVEKTMRLVMFRMFDSFKAQNASLPPLFWTRIESEMDMDDLISKLVPIFAQYYSMDDLKAINAFYDSPAGRHMIEVQPEITTQAMQVGRAWGQQLGTKVIAEIDAERAREAALPVPAAVPVK